MRVLIIEDEPKVAAFLRKGFAELGWSVDLAGDGKSGIASALAGTYDVIVLDLLLPLVHGLDVCKAIRSVRTTPILMLTALGTTEDKVKGLELGADDYVVKPFQFEELVARARVLTRRHGRSEPELFRVGDLVLDAERRLVSRAGTEIALTPREYALLHELIRQPGKIFTRAELAQRVWGITHDTGTNIIDVYIKYLRNKIDRPYERKLIHTVHGTGYIIRDDIP